MLGPILTEQPLVRLHFVAHLAVFDERDLFADHGFEVVASLQASAYTLSKAGDLRSPRNVKRKLQLPQRWGHRLAMRPSIHSSTDRFSDSGV